GVGIVVPVVAAEPGACRKCDPNVATPLHRAEVTTHPPATWTSAMAVSSIASWPPGDCKGALISPKSGPSMVPSMSVAVEMRKLFVESQVTSADCRLVTKRRPHWLRGEGHAGSTPVAQLAQ